MSMKSIQNVLLCVCINACGMMAFGGFLQSLNVLHVCFVMLQEILQYLRICCIDITQIIRGIVKGYPLGC